MPEPSVSKYFKHATLAQLLATLFSVFSAGIGGVIPGGKSWRHYAGHMIFVILWCAFAFSVQFRDALVVALMNALHVTSLL